MLMTMTVREGMDGSVTVSVAIRFEGWRVGEAVRQGRGKGRVQGCR